jgi:spore coat polysaccharide biosynthesis protein SpsF (cytidylyltransferase family)
LTRLKGVVTLSDYLDSPYFFKKIVDDIINETIKKENSDYVSNKQNESLEYLKSKVK